MQLIHLPRPNTKSSLDRLPTLHESNIRNERPKHDAPLPAYGFMFKDGLIDDRDVDNREGDDETSYDSPEEETVVGKCFKDRKATGEAYGIEIEKGSGEVL